MRKKLSALILAALLVSSPVMAAGPLVIAVVNGDQLISQSQAGKAAFAEIQRFGDVKQKEINAKQAAVKTLKDNLDAKGASLSEDARRAQELKFQRELSDLQIFARDAQEQIRRKEFSLLKPINQDLEKVIKDYAKRNNLDLVLNKSNPGLVFSSARMDITPKILEEYNRFYQTKAPAKTPAKAPAKKK